MVFFVNIDDNNKWDNIVKGFKNFDVYYLSGYVRAFQTHGDGEPKLFFYEDKNIKAINVFMKRDIEKDQNFSGKIPSATFYDAATPYGYGGFLIEGNVTDESLEALEKEYSRLCMNEGIISEFVRFHPVLNNSKVLSSIYDISELGRTVTIELGSQEQMWEGFAGNNRNKIRKAKKSGVEIYWGRSRELIDVFIPMYNETMDKDDATDYYYFKNDFYNSILEDLKYNSLMFYAVFESKIISMSIILFSNQQMHYHLSASDRNYKNLAATNLLLYEAACWGCENGYKTLHLGGGLGSREDSLYQFKKGFNKNSNTCFSIGKKIFDNEKYNELIEIRKQDQSFDENKLFFPVYRG
ncbi:lipid II:glycine glycyltransferase FemX [Acetivibrio straminisolvens]|jgi:hypothetical protein|uniref:lipid II:glycine glycyltransferase FemX n=1 Tax=Acetivibrio straminisolvens TaxID=253314 RepID=UPI00223EA8BF|nr:GNAT family N-acetyltransferase [Acetivibrio straminisolvens]